MKCSAQILLAILSIVLFPNHASSSPETEDEDVSTPAIVLLGDLNHQQNSQQIVEAVGAHLSGLPVSFRVAWLDYLPNAHDDRLRRVGEEFRTQEVFAVFWFDLIEGDEASLYFTTRNLESVFVRSLPMSSSAGLSEALGLIVHSTTSYLLQRGPELSSTELMSNASWDIVTPETHDSTVESQVEPHHVIAPDPSRDADEEGGENGTMMTTQEPQPKLMIGVGYSLLLWSNSPMVSHGLRLLVGLRLFQGLHLMLGYIVSFPLQAHLEGVEAVFRRHPIDLSIAYLHRGTRISMGGVLGLTLDPITEDVSADPEKYQALSGSTLFIDMNISYRIEVYFLRWLGLNFNIGMSVSFKDMDYAISTSTGATHIVSSPWRLHPSLTIGLTFRPI